LKIDEFNLEKELPLWTISSEGKSITQTFTFADFKHAFEFMTRCAQYAEEIDHHPDWSNSGNKVTVELTTHSAGELTELDIQLAKAMDAFASLVKQK
jgi:4a-hydroxytetrahydrobiopterin dehydratase